MSRKPIAKFRAMKDLDASAPQTSEKSNVEMVDTCCYHVKFEVPSSGTFIVEARNADVQSYDESGWFEVNFGAPLDIVSETDVQILLNELPFKEIRLKWSSIGSSGFINAYLVMKAKGA